MYSLKNVLTQAPEKVKNALLAVGTAIAGLLSLAGHSVPIENVALIALAAEKVLDLVYVQPTNAAKDEKAALVAFENVKLKARQRPLHAD